MPVSTGSGGITCTRYGSYEDVPGTKFPIGVWYVLGEKI